MLGCTENYALEVIDCWWTSNMFICICCSFNMLHVCCGCNLLSAMFAFVQAKKCLCGSHIVFVQVDTVCVFIRSMTRRIRASSARSASGTFWRPTAPSWTPTNWRSCWPSLMATLMERSATKTLSTWWDVLTFYRLADIIVQQNSVVHYHLLPHTLNLFDFSISRCVRMLWWNSCRKNAVVWVWVKWVRLSHEAD